MPRSWLEMNIARDAANAPAISGRDRRERQRGDLRPDRPGAQRVQHERARAEPDAASRRRRSPLSSTASAAVIDAIAAASERQRPADDHRGDRRDQSVSRLMGPTGSRRPRRW